MKTYRERLEMKAEDFKGADLYLEDNMYLQGFVDLANAHLTGLAEVLEGVEAALGWQLRRWPNTRAWN